MNTSMYGPSFFSFHFRIFSFSISFFKINHFYYSRSLHGLQDVENHCVHLRDIEFKSGRKIPYLRVPHVFSLYNWIGEHEITTKIIYLLRIQKKDTKKSTKRHK